MEILTAELVPESLWNKNIRKLLKSSQWDYYRRKCYQLADYVCELCGNAGDKWPVECHEKWKYDDDKHIQKLIGFIALCPDCHMVKHIGMAKVNGNFSKAVKHLSKVNGWNIEGSLEYIKNVYEIWEKRNTFKWSQDLSYLNGSKQLTLF